MNHVPITLKAVAELNHQRFFIPSYQRGYRWDAEQVCALLDDLKEFEDAKHPTKFYCLQPLVVVRRKPEGEGLEEWEVVDGQQRLTTVFLILNQRVSDGGAKFHIRYERHPEHGDGLGGLLRADAAGGGTTGFVSPDLHFLRKANDEIRAWLARNPGQPLSSLTNDGSGCAKFIWHVVEDRAEAIRAFTRLNAGKIKLEDSELIRALFLRSGALDEDDRQRIALRWDQMERRLQDPEFWSFLTREKGSDSRIGLLFKLIADREGWPFARERQIFDHIQGLLKNSLERKKLWQQVEDLFSTLEEWFEDNRLFHLVGFLIDQREGLAKLLLAASKRGKTSFTHHLKQTIRAWVLPEVTSPYAMRKRLAEIRYGDAVKPLLLCANLAALDADDIGTVRFSFHAYRAVEWDIEHIRATASRPPESVKELKETLEMILDYWERRGEHDNELDEARQALGQPTPDNKRLGVCYHRLCERTEGGTELPESDHLGNLTLLDAGTNRGYGNSPFAVKRAWVLGIDRPAKYLLPCTRNVFTKSDSPAPVNLLHWTSEDAQAYLAATENCLVRFFADTWGEEEA